jgi:hypothetical protein
MGISVFLKQKLDILYHLLNHVTGWLFASPNCICILATCQLLPAAIHPQGVEDIAASLLWALKDIGKYGGNRLEYSQLVNQQDEQILQRLCSLDFLGTSPFTLAG